jgi:hypothetical protein
MTGPDVSAPVRARLVLSQRQQLRYDLRRDADLARGSQSVALTPDDGGRGALLGDC